MASELKIEFNPDGTLKLNARNMIGDEDELLADLTELASAAGGTLKVEKHEPGLHHHHHGSEGHHQKAGR